MIRVDWWSVGLHEGFHLVESFGVFVFPFEGVRSLEQISEWSEHVWATRPHILAMSNESKKCLQLFQIFGNLHCQDSFDLFGCGSIPEGVNQCPRKSVSCIPHSHLQGSMMKPSFGGRCGTVSRRLR